jgi:hypothetical protein
MNITTNPRTRIRSQITKAITIKNTTKTTNSSTKNKDNNPRIRTRAGIPMPPGRQARRGGVGCGA